MTQSLLTTDTHLSEEVLALFQSHLSGVAFPDVDQERLEAQSAQVARARNALDQVHQALVEAEEALQKERDALVELSTKALAYAKVYAEPQSELAQAVEAIRPSRAKNSESRKARRKARKKTPNPNKPTLAGLALVDRPEPGAESEPQANCAN